MADDYGIGEVHVQAVDAQDAVAEVENEQQEQVCSCSRQVLQIQRALYRAAMHIAAKTI